MAAATVTYRYSGSLGPIKIEILNMASITDADTVSTLMQRPLIAMAVQNTDANASTVATNVTISGKTLTVNDSNLSTDELNILVFGF